METAGNSKMHLIVIHMFNVYGTVALLTTASGKES